MTVSAVKPSAVPDPSSPIVVVWLEADSVTASVAIVGAGAGVGEGTAPPPSPPQPDSIVSAAIAVAVVILVIRLTPRCPLSPKAETLCPGLRRVSSHNRPA